ncbi:hypothetical protein [Methylibium sp.]|uniref:hypothetical protein n=1 Tax=Methylibium sp. TaxID=2067992 RepID=UPI003BA9D4D0
MSRVTFHGGHRMRVGEIVLFTTGTRWQRLKNLLRRPRVNYVSEVIDDTTFAFEERRMTWAEWRGELWSLLKP